MSFVMKSMKVIRSQRVPAGSGPAATSFLCFAKESKQRKATTLPLAFGFPIVRVKKWESLETRLRLKQQGFLYPFSASHNWQCQKWMKVKINFKTRTNNYRNGFKCLLSLYVVIPAQAGIQCLLFCDF